MAINPAQFLNPQQWQNNTQGAVQSNYGDIEYDPLRDALQRMAGSPNLSGDPIGGQSLPGSSVGWQALSAPMSGGTPTQIPGGSLEVPTITDNRQYFKGIPVPLSPNNPMLAYLPKPGKGQLVTKKFIEAAIREEERLQAQQDLEQNRGRMSSVVLRALSEAAGNEGVMSENRDLINMYGGMADLIKLPGGENIAMNILNELKGMYTPRPQAPEDPLMGLKKEKLRAEINKLRSDAAKAGLTGSGDDRMDRLKAYDNAYRLYLQSNGAKWNPYANGGDGGWEYPTGFKPIPQVEFIRRSFPNGDQAAKEYMELLTGLPVPEQPTTTKSSNKPYYRPNAGYSVSQWNDAEVISNARGGPGKALIYLATEKGAKPGDLLFKILVDRYNQNYEKKPGFVPYSPQRFYEAFILKKKKARNKYNKKYAKKGEETIKG